MTHTPTRAEIEMPTLRERVNMALIRFVAEGNLRASSDEVLTLLYNSDSPPPNAPAFDLAEHQYVELPEPQRVGGDDAWQRSHSRRIVESGRNVVPEAVFSEGYRAAQSKSVPREPTEAMVSAAAFAPDDDDWHASWVKSWKAAFDAYGAEI